MINQFSLFRIFFSFAFIFMPNSCLLKAKFYSINDTDPLLFNLTFTENITLPTFQLFT